MDAYFSNSTYLLPGIRILDAGCGTGIVSRVLYRSALEKGLPGITLRAFDLTPEMLKPFREWNLKHAAGSVELIQADVLKPGDLPADWKEFDLIVTSTMLEYLPANKVKQALFNLRQLLKPGGRLLIFLTKRNLITAWLGAKWWQARTYTASEIEELLLEDGFSKIQFKEFTPGWSGFILGVEAIIDRK